MYAQYDKFSVSEPRTRYKVHVGGYSGTAGGSHATRGPCWVDTPARALGLGTAGDGLHADSYIITVIDKIRKYNILCRDVSFHKKDVVGRMSYVPLVSWPFRTGIILSWWIYFLFDYSIKHKETE